MSSIDNTPENRNFLSPLNFKFTVKKLPYTNFFLQKVNIPSITTKTPYVGTPFVAYPTTYDHLDFGDLKIEFKVDEELTNYMELFNWIMGIGFPNSYEQYEELADADKPFPTGNGIFSDISLMVLSSTKMPNYEIVYEDCFPNSLGELQFNTVDSTVNYISVAASFKYTKFTIDSI